MIKDLVLKNRSYRAYDESCVMTREDLLELVDVARLCGSTTNKQALKFYIAWERGLVDAIVPLTRWAGMLPERGLPDPGKHPSAFIIVCVDKEIQPDPANKWIGYDTGIAVQSMLLAAAEKGLGGLMIGSVKFAELSELLNLSDRFQPILAVAFGKPDEEVRLTGLPADGSTKYYRDENDVHYVPKRTLEELVINY